MTKEELKEKHPDTYNSILNAGVIQERSRVQKWIKNNNDVQSILYGIQSGKSPEEAASDFYNSIDNKLKTIQ